MMLKKKMAAYFVHGHKCVIFVIPPPPPPSPSPMPRKRHLGYFSQKYFANGFCKLEICGVPSEIPRKKCHMRKADKRTYRARDVERDGGYNKGRDLARFMLHVYKMTTALFCHYSGCAVLESDGEQ